MIHHFQGVKWHVVLIMLLVLLSIGLFWYVQKEVVLPPKEPPEYEYINIPDFTFLKVGPVLKAPIAWANDYLEDPMMIEYKGNYYLYFCARPPNADVYRIGVATSKSPTGPWTVAADPILSEVAGSWESAFVSSPYVLMVNETFYMWYTGQGKTGSSTEKGAIGLATASSPVGPWTKYGINPIFIPKVTGRERGWLGSVQKINNTYYMWYGGEWAVRLATAPTPEGPWTDQGIVLSRGKPGTWEYQAVLGESGVVYHQGLFHMFYSGMRLPASPEPEFPVGELIGEIGYAVSLDGRTWLKSSLNPVIKNGAAGEADSYSLRCVSIFTKDNTFYIYYMGMRHVDAIREESICLAIATY